MLPIFSFISTLGPSIINTTYSSLGILHSLWHGIFKVKKILLIYRKAEKDITGSSCSVTRAKQHLISDVLKGFQPTFFRTYAQSDRQNTVRTATQELSHEEGNQQFPLLPWIALECRQGPKHLFMMNRNWTTLFQSGFSYISMVDGNAAMHVYSSDNNQIQDTPDHHNIGHQNKF